MFCWRRCGRGIMERQRLVEANRFRRARGGQTVCSAVLGPPAVASRNCRRRQPTIAPLHAHHITHMRAAVTHIACAHTCVRSAVHVRMSRSYTSARTLAHYSTIVYRHAKYTGCTARQACNLYTYTECSVESRRYIT